MVFLVEKVEHQRFFSTFSNISAVSGQIKISIHVCGFQRERVDVPVTSLSPSISSIHWETGVIVPDPHGALKEMLY